MVSKPDRATSSSEVDKANGLTIFLCLVSILSNLQKASFHHGLGNINVRHKANTKNRAGKKGKKC